MNPAHRPSEYNEDKVKVVFDEYLSKCGREQTKLPKLTEFYRELGISSQCASEWQKKYAYFGDTCKKLMDLQQEELTDDGLFGGKEVNVAMAIFLLKANHGMIETSRQVLGGEIDATTGKQQPLFVNAGNGFLPATIALQQVSTGSATESQGEVQGSGVAPESTQDLHSNNGTSETSPS